MSKHTPGPWSADHYGVRDRGGYICEFHWPHRYDGQEERYQKELAERQADARLIAVAPDLLEALQQINAYTRPTNWDEMDDETPAYAKHSRERIAAWKALDAAIAKATWP